MAKKCDPSFASDPDIAGLGVLISFCIACASTLVLTWPFFAKLPWNEYFITHFDHLVWRAAKLKGFLKEAEWTEKSERAEHRHRSLVLALSDTQLIASIAMMVAVALKDDVSLYHFSIVYSLVWLAANAHFTALGYAAPRLVCYPTIRAARFASLLLLVALLLFFIIVKGTDGFYFHHPGIPVRDILPVEPGDIGGDQSISLAMDLLFVIFNFLTTSIRLFPELKKTPRFQKRCSHVLGRLRNGLLAKAVQSFFPDDQAVRVRTLGPIRIASNITLSIVLWFPLWLLLFLLRMVYVAVTEITLGMILSILIDILWFSFIILDILESKDWAESHMCQNEYQKEQSWGFGQMVAVLLIAAPVWSIWLSREETAYKEAAKGRQCVLPFIRPAVGELEAYEIQRRFPFRFRSTGALKSPTF